MASPIKTFAVSISTGATGLSGAISLEGQTPFAIEMSTGWTAASITMQGSRDGTNFFNLYKDDGTEYSLTATASRYIVLQNPNHFIGLKALKLRSGTSGSAVAQAATRALTLVGRDV